VEWRLVRDKDDDAADVDPAAPRWFTAYGRDVDVPEARLDYDPGTRRLTVAGGTRRESKVAAAFAALRQLLADTPGLSGRQIDEQLLAQHKRQDVRAAVALGCRTGDIATEPGPRRSTLHSLSAPVRHSAPPVRQRSECECASALIDGALHTHCGQRQCADGAHHRGHLVTAAPNPPPTTGHVRQPPPPQDPP
jgi:hypothetical protein